MTTDVENISIIYEDIQLKKVGDRTVEGKDIPRDDLSNFIFAHTNGGTEHFTIWTIRTNDSKTDPNKRAGDEMVANGTLKIPGNKSTGAISPLGNPQEKYTNYGVITMYVSSLDGEDFNKNYPNPKDRIRNIKLLKAFKLKIGGEIYNIV